MAYFPAADMILSVLDAQSPAQYQPIGALKSVQMQITHSEEDVSTKGSNRYRELYPDGSQAAYAITGEFVLTDANGFTDLQAAAHSQSPKIMAKLDDGTFVYGGLWQITQWQVTSGAFGAVQGSVSLQSSGTITPVAS